MANDPRVNNPADSPQRRSFCNLPGSDPAMLGCVSRGHFARGPRNLTRESPRTATMGSAERSILQSPQGPWRTGARGLPEPVGKAPEVVISPAYDLSSVLFLPIMENGEGGFAAPGWGRVVFRGNRVQIHAG